MAIPTDAVPAADQTISHPELCNRDFYLWIEKAVTLLQAGNLGDLDLENLIDEIESMGRSEKRIISSNLEIIFMHLLKYKYQPDQRSNSWRYTLLEHRRRLSKDFKTSPSLKGYFLEEFAQVYTDARESASTETGMDINLFPFKSPFTPEQVLDKDYLPEA